MLLILSTLRVLKLPPNIKEFKDVHPENKLSILVTFFVSNSIDNESKLLQL